MVLSARKFAIPVLLLGFMLWCGFAQVDSNLKLYDVDSTLSWDDFRMQYSPNAKYVAEVEVNFNISTRPTRFRDSVITEIHAYLDPDSSYVKPGRQTDSLLRHEQGHYQIAEIYARKLRKTISEMKYCPTYTDSVVRLYKSLHVEYRKFQVAYDVQTNHSLNRPQQAIWNMKIDSLLTAYSAYTNPVIGKSKKNAR
jgi:hypothetical protein